MGFWMQPKVFGALALTPQLVLACGGDWVVERERPEDTGSECPEAYKPSEATIADHPRGLRVVGNSIEDAEGHAVMFRGVNRSGTEYRCVQNLGIFDGPSDEASVQALARWNVNAVRVPLNEACWLRLEDVADAYSGETYKTAILDYVELLHRYGIVPILELHWAAPNGEQANRQFPMPNVDHTPAFWADVAMTFLDDDAVIFEPYNEPYPDRNSDSDAAWECWRDGCEEYIAWGPESGTYEAAGMQALVDAIRETGSEHIILLGGVQFSNSLSQWLEHKPDDPLEGLAAAWHIYNFNGCSDEDCYNSAPADVRAEVPLVATELGQDDCMGDFISPLIEWLEEGGSSYLAWSWNALGACIPTDRVQNVEGQPWSLIADYKCPIPNGVYAETFHGFLTGK